MICKLQSSGDTVVMLEGAVGAQRVLGDDEVIDVEDVATAQSR
jgi:hypothetical protein